MITLRSQDPVGHLSETRAICASGSHSFIHLQALVRYLYAILVKNSRNRRYILFPTDDSCVATVFTILTVVPGLASYDFKETNCTVVESRYRDGLVSCPVTNIMHRGCER